MEIKALFLCTLCAVNQVSLGHNSQILNPIVTIKDGKLKGIIGINIDGEKFCTFLGIPYAKPPLGELRFKLAQKPEPWKGLRDANQPGDACISRDDFTPDIVGSEDCLYLNVYTRNLPTVNSSLKPVMLYIHGGGLTLGTGGPRVYGPEFLMLKDIVLVTINYRLGILGFLSLTDPKLGVPGNLGLKDQNLALKWVQENIRSFNGDPDKVTIFGNSAGAASVHAHILSPASSGLFHKAILQSGCVMNSWFWGSKDNALEVASKAGSKVSTQSEALDVLKHMSVSEIFAAQEKIYDSPYPADRRPFSAVIEAPNDSAFLAENPVRTIKSGNYNRVPIMMGYTENEGMLLDLDNLNAEKAGQKIPEINFENVLPVDLNVAKGSNDSIEILSALRKLYSGASSSSRYDPMTDGYMLVAIFETLRRHLRNGLRPIYLYRMSLAGELNQIKRLLNRTHEPGVSHGDDLGYLFHTAITPEIIPESLEDRSLRTFVKLWTNFATHGNPTANDQLNVSWIPVESETNIRVLDIGKELKMRDFPELERLTVWWDILKKWPLQKFS